MVVTPISYIGDVVMSLLCRGYHRNHCWRQHEQLSWQPHEKLSRQPHEQLSWQPHEQAGGNTRQISPWFNEQRHYRCHTRSTAGSPKSIFAALTAT